MTAVRPPSPLRLWKLLYTAAAAGLIGCVLIGVTWGSYEAMTWTVGYVRAAGWPIYPQFAGLVMFFVVLGAGLVASMPIVFLAVAMLSRTDLIGGLRRLRAKDANRDGPEE